MKTQQKTQIETMNNLNKWTYKSVFKKDYCIFILSYWRPNTLATIKALYNSWLDDKVPIYIVCSDDDKTLPEYKELYWDNVFVFNKQEAKQYTDTCDNFWKEKDWVVVYARNFCFKLAKQLWYEYFLQLDDDYVSFSFKVTSWDVIIWKKIKYCITEVIENFFSYLDSTDNITAIAFAQGWDFIGWAHNWIETSIIRKRKIMNSFFFKTNQPVNFSWRINEDVNMYITEWNLWKVFITCPYVYLNQWQTQQNKGGLTESYLDNWTYVKSFYSVIVRPNAAKVKHINWNVHKRIHHQIVWKKAVPMIIPEKFKKV